MYSRLYPDNSVPGLIINGRTPPRFADTVCALLAERMSGGRLMVSVLNGMSELIKAPEIKDLFCVIIDRSADPHVLKEQMEGAGFRKVDKATSFFQSTGKVYCFLNDERRASVVVSDRDRVDELACGIPVFLPWLFTSKTLDSDELRLLKACRGSDAEFLQIISRFYERHRETVTRSLVGDFSRQYLNGRLVKARSDLEEFRQKIKTITRNLADLMAQKREVELELLGLLAGDKDENNELADYIVSNKKIEILSCQDGILDFRVRGYLTYFDKAVAEVLIKKRSVLFGWAKGTATPQQEELLFRAIFLENKVRVRFWAEYILDTVEMRVKGVRTTKQDGFTEGYTGNPHIAGYACLGDYAGIIYECMGDNDYVSAIEQCVASCSSLNLLDSPVMKFMMQRFYGNKCLELPDGRVVDAEEAIRYLEEEQK